MLAPRNGVRLAYSWSVRPCYWAQWWAGDLVGKRRPLDMGQPSSDCPVQNRRSRSHCVLPAREVQLRLAPASSPVGTTVQQIRGKGAAQMAVEETLRTERKAALNMTPLQRSNSFLSNPRSSTATRQMRRNAPKTETFARRAVFSFDHRVLRGSLLPPEPAGEYRARDRTHLRHSRMRLR